MRILDTLSAIEPNRLRAADSIRQQLTTEKTEFITYTAEGLL